MKDLLELKADLKIRRERFNQYRVVNISENILNESIQVSAPESIKSKFQGLIKDKLQEKFQGKLQEKLQGKLQEKFQGKLKEKVGEIKEKVGEIKRFNKTMKQGYFNRSRSTLRTYKAMI